MTPLLLCLAVGSLSIGQEPKPENKNQVDKAVQGSVKRESVENPAIGVLVREVIQEDVDPIERWKKISTVNAHYVVVHDQVRKRITEQPAKPGMKISWMSSLHSAIVLAGYWRIKEAENALIARISIRLDPTTVPTGMMLSGEDFYPAAMMLARMGVRSSVLLEAISTQRESDLPLLVWVLAKTQTRENAAVLLKHYSEVDYYEASRMKKALQILESVEHVPELIPSPFAKE